MLFGDVSGGSEGIGYLEGQDLFRAFESCCQVVTEKVKMAGFFIGQTIN